MCGIPLDGVCAGLLACANSITDPTETPFLQERYALTIAQVSVEFLQHTPTVDPGTYVASLYAIFLFLNKDLPYSFLGISLIMDRESPD
jgi:hypothetical protein